MELNVIVVLACTQASNIGQAYLVYALELVANLRDGEIAAPCHKPSKQEVDP
jgi:hypothetical protein